jgi:hypothetical protein
VCASDAVGGAVQAICWEDMLLGELRQALTVAQLLMGKFEMCWGLVSEDERAGSAWQ